MAVAGCTAAATRSRTPVGQHRELCPALDNHCPGQYQLSGAAWWRAQTKIPDSKLVCYEEVLNHCPLEHVGVIHCTVEQQVTVDRNAQLDIFVCEKKRKVWKRVRGEQ